MNHTPGPWYIEDSGLSDEHQEPVLHISPEDGFGVRPLFRAKVTMFPVRKTKIGGPKHKELAAECEATARLIAAAPDLLTALKAIINSVPFPHSHERTRAAALAAIVKATGEQA